MHTKYHVGLHILFDDESSNTLCSSIKTSKSNHLVSAYLSGETNRIPVDPLYNVVVNNKGVRHSPFTLPDLTNGTQKDAVLIPVDNTDRFISVWCSDAISSRFRIYMRSHQLNDVGKLVSQGLTIQVSQSYGDYVGPKAIYITERNQVIVSWLSVDSKNIHIKAFKLKEDGNFEEDSYEFMTSGSFLSDEYFNRNLDLSRDTERSISFIRAGKLNIFMGNVNNNGIGIYSVDVANGNIFFSSLANYERQNIGCFNAIYDVTKLAIKIVFSAISGNGNVDILGDNIRLFGLNNPRGMAVPLNERKAVCSSPSIANIGESGNFVVAWQTSNGPIYFNEFDSDYSIVGDETSINDERDTIKPSVVVTSNQTAIVFSSRAYQGKPLSDYGVLYFVADHESY